METTGKEISPDCGDPAGRVAIGVDAAYAAMQEGEVISAGALRDVPPVDSAAAVKTDPPQDVLTPRQNELISEALCAIAEKICANQSASGTLGRMRRALVSELAAVTRETNRRSALAGVRSIDG